MSKTTTTKRTTKAAEPKITTRRQRKPAAITKPAVTEWNHTPVQEFNLQELKRDHARKYEGVYLWTVGFATSAGWLALILAWKIWG